MDVVDGLVLWPANLIVMASRPASRFTSTNKPPSGNRWLFRLVNVAGAVGLVFILAWQVGWPSREWMQGVRAPTQAPVAVAPVHPVNKPIGLAPPKPRGNDTSSSPVPLPLLLVRTTPALKLQDAIAQIGVYRDSPQTYQGGAILENGASIAEIHADYVVLQKDNHTIRLYVDASHNVGNNADALTTVGGRKPEPPAVITNHDILTDYIRPSPVYDGQTLIGYEVYPGNKSGPFAQMGLQAGDVITELNGQPLNDSNSAWRILNQMTEGTSLSATIKRHGASQQLSVDGSFLTRAEESMHTAQSPAFAPPPPM